MSKPKVIVLRNEHECKCINLENLLYVYIDDYLSTFYLKNEQKFTCTKSLLEVKSILPNNFFRINRNCVLNIYAIDTIELHNRAVILSNSYKFIVSHRRMKQLQNTLTSPKATFAD
jgi:DNA-binding LytR/AlgR family response regulator